MSNHNQSQDILQAALYYADLGFSVVPIYSIKEDGACDCNDGPNCEKPGKHSNGPWKKFQHTALTQEEIKKVFLDLCPGANLGLVTGAVSGLFIVDIDGGNLDELFNKFPGLKENPPAIAMSRPGHYHLYFKYDPALKLKNRARVDDYIDIRTDGGYVVAVPSRHASGNDYQWLEGNSLDERGLVPINPEFAKYLQNQSGKSKKQKDGERAYAEKALESEITRVQSASEGERNDTLNRAAFSLAQFFPHGLLDPEHVRSSLTETALSIGLGEEETSTTIDSGFDAGSKQPRDLSSLKPVAVNSNNSNNSSGGWSEPEEHLDSEIPAVPYPVDALPKGARDAVKEYIEYANVPAAVAGNAAVANMSLAAQGLADVARDSVLKGPCSLNIITVAESGERKTSVERTFGKGAWLWEQEKRKEYKEKLKKFQAKREAYDEVIKGLKSKIKTAQTAEEREPLIVELTEQKMNAPLKPVNPIVFYQDTTIQALGMSLATSYPSAILSMDEGGIIVGGHSMSMENAMQTFAILNGLWDGSGFRCNRITREDYQAQNKRLSVSLAMQPEVFGAFCAAGDNKSRATGNMARFLIAQPNSTIGNRPYKSPSDMIAVKKFNNTIYKIMQMMPKFEGIEDAEVKPTLFEIIGETRKIWIEYYNECEEKQREYREFEELRDFASKSAEQAARIACVFHVFEYQDTERPIEAETMLRAIQLARWYLDEAKRVLTNMKVPEAVNNAEKLWKWLQGKVKSEGRYEFNAKEILQYGPNPVRKKDKRNEALDVLTGHGYIKHKNEGRALIISVNPLIC